MWQRITLTIMLASWIWTGADAEPLGRLVDTERDELWTSFKTAYDKVYDDEFEDSYRFRNLFLLSIRHFVIHQYSKHRLLKHLIAYQYH